MVTVVYELQSVLTSVQSADNRSLKGWKSMHFFSTITEQ